MTLAPLVQPAVGGTSRRMRNKQRRRADIRQAAQSLFVRHGFDAVTVADVARAAGVSLQTVYNHFPSKEDLFFDGHTAWVQGPAQAVALREPGCRPLTALRRYLVADIRRAVRFESSPYGRHFLATVATTPTLTAKERELSHEAERLLRDELIHAGLDGSRGCGRSDRAVVTLASVIAGTWLTAMRVLRAEQRDSGGTSEARAEECAALAEEILGRLTPLAESSLQTQSSPAR